MQPSNNHNQQMIHLNNHQHHGTTGSNQIDQSSAVTLALRDLNTSLPHDRQIKMIIFLYSKFSQKSDMLIKALPQDCRKFFYYICIDNKIIRDKIVNSSTIKITEVPCVLLIDINDTISTYEGDRSVEIIKIIHELNAKHQLSKHAPNCQCPVHKKDIKPHQNIKKYSKDTVTSLSSIIEDDEQSSEFPQESKQPPRRSPIPDKMPVPPIEETVHEEIPNSIRAKIRRANRPIDNHDEIFEQERPDVGLSSARSLPSKGVGHENMARSSLNQSIPHPNQQNKKQQIQISGGEVLDDELDDMLDDDPTIDPLIRTSMNSNKNGSVDKKDSMNSVKKAAEEMKRMREDESSNV